MSAGPDSAVAAPSEWVERIKKWREDLLKGAIIGLPTTVMTGLQAQFAKPLVNQPWTVLLYALPLIALGWLTWRVARANTRSSHWAFLAFLIAYCAGFAFLSTSELLVWSRTPRIQAETSRAWLVPARWGDWRYRIAPASTAPASSVVVMLDTPADDDVNRLRAEKIQLVDLIAATPRVHGIAFDFFFEGKSHVDDILCDKIAALKIPVFAGYTVESEGGVRAPIRPNVNPLEKCIPFATHEGHLLAWADADQRVRTLPLLWAGEDHKPAFSLQIARALAAQAKRELVVPTTRMLRYLPPADAIDEIDLERVRAKPSTLSDTFVFVGQRSAADTFATPFGTHSGTWVQAAATYSLLTSTYMQRTSAVTSALLVFVACYIIVLLAAAQKAVKWLVLAALAISLAVVLLAAIAAWFRIWLDAVYAIAACWLLLPWVVLVQRAMRRSL